MKQSYVVGYLFDQTERKVVLIEKNKPKWQAGKINGVGGKIEPNESPFDAMCREFREEADMDILNWTHVATLSNENFEVHMFKAHGDVSKVKSITEEKLIIADPLNLPDNVIWDLRWAIPLSMANNVQLPITFVIPSLPGEG